MAPIGPQLPPHLQKRKWDGEEDTDSPPPKTSRKKDNGPSLSSDNSEEDGYGPSAPVATLPSPRPIGPALPQPTPDANTDEIPPRGREDDDNSDESMGPEPAPQSRPQPQPQPQAQPPRKRLMGPAPPPADTSSRPTAGPDSDFDSDSDSDDGYGPALPGAKGASRRTGPCLPPSTTPTAPAAPKRDDWMLAPPTSTGYRERDPTKIKARRFASGPGSGSGSRSAGDAGISSIWTETPEQKAKRLADAVLGRGEGPDATVPAAPHKHSHRRGDHRDREREDKIRAFTEQTRGRSLYEEHQAAKKTGKAAPGGGSHGLERRNGQEEEEEDDPSKRAFDKEKDMGLGMRVTQSQRRELLNRASNFGGRFQQGSFL